MTIPHDITTWTDWELDNLNYPYEPEWMSSVLNPANFHGYRGEYGGYFNGGRYSFEFVLPEITYELAYACPNPPTIDPVSVSDAGATGIILLATVATLAVLKRFN